VVHHDRKGIVVFKRIRVCQDYWFNQGNEIDAIKTNLVKRIDKLKQWVEN